MSISEMELDCDKVIEHSSKVKQNKESYITNMSSALKDIISMDVSICTHHFLSFIFSI